MYTLSAFDICFCFSKLSFVCWCVIQFGITMFWLCRAIRFQKQFAVNGKHCQISCKQKRTVLSFVLAYLAERV
jgi:hypothetical protein